MGAVGCRGQRGKPAKYDPYVRGDCTHRLKGVMRDSHDSGLAPNLGGTKPVRTTQQPVVLFVPNINEKSLLQSTASRCF